jgi:hypothetical protein
MPLFNAVGNHDVGNRELYRRHFGDVSYGDFVLGRTLFLILDTELDRGRISGEQLDFLDGALNAAEKEDRIASVVLFSHRLLFVPDDPRFDIVFLHLNSRQGYRTDGSFRRDVLPHLKRLATRKPVVWMAGDIGVSRSLPLFFHREEDVDLTWIATGMGDTADDVLLRLEAAPTGKIAIEVISLDGREEKVMLESMGMAFWKQHFGLR